MLCRTNCDETESNDSQHCGRASILGRTETMVEDETSEISTNECLHVFISISPTPTGDVSS